MKRCPNCRAKYKTEAICYRCGFDYSRSLKCEALGIKNYNNSLRSFKNYHYQEALTFISKAIEYDNQFYYRKLRTMIVLSSELKKKEENCG